MKKPFTFIGQQASTDTIEVLKEALQCAEDGECLGAALILIRKQRNYSVAFTGEAARSPTFTLGTVAVLQQTLLTHLQLK